MIYSFLPETSQTAMTPAMDLIECEKNGHQPNGGQENYFQIHFFLFVWYSSYMSLSLKENCVFLSNKNRMSNKFAILCPL